MSNRAIITLACPACGHAFMTLSDNGGGDEICPHCTRAAPRSSYLAGEVLNTTPAPAPVDLPAKQAQASCITAAQVLEASPPAVVDSFAAQRGNTFQPHILGDSPIALFIRSQAGGAVASTQSDWAPFKTPPIIENQSAAQPVISEFRPQAGTALPPLWRRLGIEPVVDNRRKVTKSAPLPSRYVAQRNSVSAWAIILTMIIAVGGGWMVWFGPEMQVVHPVKSAAPAVAASIRTEKKIATSPAQSEEIRKALPAKPVLPPLDISAR
jgi:hypothetical protein